jgi:hypothetical protein
LWYKFSEIVGHALISGKTYLRQSKITLLSFFKINDPFRILGIVVCAIILTLVYLFVDPIPLTQPQLIWMVLGERLSDGGLLYFDVIDDTGPLSAAFFALVNILFGRNMLAYELLGRVLILFQVFFWNTILIKYRVFNDNTYLPAIIMLVLFHISFDLLRLSPTLLGSTFLILALGQLFSQTVLQKDVSESTLLIGIYGGLATGFNPNYVLFLPYMIFIGIAISGFSFKQLMLSLVGFFLPILLICVYYFWNDGLESALEIWPLIFQSDKYQFQSYISWLILLAFPALLALAGYIFCAVLRGSTINQQKQRQVIIIWLFFSALEFFLIKRQASYQLVIFIPGLTYLITQFFMNMGSGTLAKLSFNLLVFGLPLFAFRYWQGKVEDHASYFIEKSEPIRYPGKLMILGEDLSPYVNSPMGGPFLNFKLSKTYLNRERGLPERAKLFQLLQSQKAEVVLDQEGVFKKILQEYPELSKQYVSPQNGVFVLK